MIRLEEGGSVLEIDESVGNLPLWQVGARTVLHAAPWRDEPQIQRLPDIPLCEKRLAGDFFCMPFALPDGVTADPLHGYTANSRWAVLDQGAAHADLRLQRTVRGAVVTKKMRIAGPVLYQSHIIEGGAGDITMAHHPMARMADGGRMSFSPKRAVLTDPAPQYEGHNLWKLDQTSADYVLDCEDGTTWDLRDYPTSHAVEDFAVMVEAEGHRLGWSVLMRHAEDDMLVILKDPRVLPVTMLWISNGGRDFPPWNSRHIGVIGIEDGIAAGATGFQDALRDTRLAAMGVPVTHPLGARLVVRHAMISLPRPAGWSDVVDVTLADGRATLTEAGGDTVSVPFEDGHFA